MREREARVVGVFLVLLVTTAGPVTAQPLVSSPANGTVGLDPAVALTLAWTTVPNASEYVVELSESQSFLPLLPLKDAFMPAQAGHLGQTYLVQFTDDTVLQAGRTYYWRVTAVVTGARVTSATATFTTASDPFGWLAHHKFALTRSEDGVDKDKPATVGFIRQGGDKVSQQVVAEFLLAWQGRATFIPRDGSFALSPSFAFAGKMSSDRAAHDTLARVAGGVIADWSFGQTPTRSLYQTLNVTYEGDQAFDQAKVLLDYLLTYSGPGVGRFYPASAAAPVQILFRPYLLAAFGKQTAAAASMRDTRTRAGPQLDVKVRLNLLARALGLSGSLLAVTDRWYSLAGYERDSGNFFTASLDFQIAKGFTFGYIFTRGRDAPAFKGVNQMALTVGVGFK